MEMSVSPVEGAPASVDIEALEEEVHRNEKRISRLLKEAELTDRSIEYAFPPLQESYQTVIFADFRRARSQDYESRMWNYHYKVIKRYRDNLAAFERKDTRRRPVELRKLQDSFTHFLKLVIRFYRSYIQRLVSHFWLKDLEWVIDRSNLSSKSSPKNQFLLYCRALMNVVSAPDETPNVSPEIKDGVIHSCYQSLVYLGDLSRYRELTNNPKNWGPAIGYYTLAQELVPEYATPHNQLAVIASDEGSTLSAVYHLWRAVSSLSPTPPQYNNNLDLALKKIPKRKDHDLVSSVRKEEHAVRDLIPLFLRLHARCYLGDRFADYESSESEMLTQLALDLKDRNLSNGMLAKLVLINIAAQYRSLTHAPSHRSPFHPSSFLRLNIATFTTLHQVFQAELAPSPNISTIENISAVGRRMLPSLRLYSTWLRRNYPVLVGLGQETAVSVMCKQLWVTYANTLSLLAPTFSVDALPTVPYLLEEDKESIGFHPFAPYASPLRPTPEQLDGTRAHPNEEMLTRIRFLLEDGLSLCQQPDVPLTMVGGTVTYQEDGISSTPSIGMNSGLNSSGDVNSPFLGRLGGGRDESVAGQAGTSIVDSVAGSEGGMNRMVDSLVGPREGPWEDEGLFGA